MILMHVNIKEKAEIVRSIATELNEEVKVIGYRELNRTLTGLSLGRVLIGSVSIPKLYQMPELLVFIGMDEDKLDAFLEKYKESKAEPVALKAVATSHNISWTVYELIENLKKEIEG